MGKTSEATKARIELPAGYVPSDKEPFMNERQQEYFRRKLQAWKDEIIAESKSTLDLLQEDMGTLPDMADRASNETDRSLELRARDRQRKLVSTYGYCEETGEPIGLDRLDARPVATLSLDAQERHERNERVHRDD